MSVLWPTSEMKTALLRRAVRAVGLVLEEGTNHTDVVQVHTGLKTQIPRHRTVKRELARAIVRYIITEMQIPEDVMREALKTELRIFPESKG